LSRVNVSKFELYIVARCFQQRIIMVGSLQDDAGHWLCVCDFADQLNIDKTNYVIVNHHNLYHRSGAPTVSIINAVLETVGAGKTGIWHIVHRRLINPHN